MRLFASRDLALWVQPAGLRVRQRRLNMRDYYWNNVERFTAPGFFETFLQHNCLQDQAND